MPACSSARAASAASRPAGVRTRTAYSRSSLSAGMPFHVGGPRFQRWHAREDALEVLEGLADADAVGAEQQLPDRVLVTTRALLEHRDGLLELPARFEVAKHEHGVGQVAH